VARVNFANVIQKKYMGEKMWCISSASAVLQSILNIPIHRFFSIFSSSFFSGLSLKQ
jgi:hypothetical protein